MAKSFCCILLLLLYPLPAVTGQVLDHYEIDLAILPEEEILRAEVVISVTVPEGGLRSIRFFLNRGLVIHRLSCTAAIRGFHLDTEKRGEYRYAPEAIPLTIDFRDFPFPGEKVEIHLAYGGSIEADAWEVNRVSRDWIELGMYSAWFPFNPAYSSFTYDVDIELDSSYRLLGPGNPTFSEGKWRLGQASKTNDIVFLGSRDLKIRNALDAQIKLRIAHAGLTDGQVKRIASDALGIADLFSRWFHTPRSSDITIVFAKRSRGGGYSKPGFVVTLFDESESDYPAMVKSLAHEIAHFWWSGAPTTTWEDWLNESFAEYAALMWIREMDGEEAFDGYVKKLEKAAADTPALWGIDRDEENAFGVLYRKGPLILCRLEQKIGWEKFFRFLILLIDRKVESTMELLDTLESITSRAIRDRFESDLKRP